jgi:hypothetical protein
VLEASPDDIGADEAILTGFDSEDAVAGEVSGDRGDESWGASLPDAPKGAEPPGTPDSARRGHKPRSRGHKPAGGKHRA